MSRYTPPSAPVLWRVPLRRRSHRRSFRRGWNAAIEAAMRANDRKYGEYASTYSRFKHSYHEGALDALDALHQELESLLKEPK